MAALRVKGRAGAHSAASSSWEVGAASEGIAAAARSSRAMGVEWEELQAPPEQAPAQEIGRAHV